MKQKLERSLVVAVLVLVFAGGWLGSLDNVATGVVDEGLKRALISFASARALNATLSVIQSADLSAKPLGFGLSLTVGQIVHPINELVGQFAELMLAASVIFGVMKFLIIIGKYEGITVLLSVAALGWAWFIWRDRACPSWLMKVLLVLVLVRFAVPVVFVGSDAVFTRLLKDRYDVAQRGITVDENWLAPTIKSWLAVPKDAVVDQVKNFGWPDLSKKEVQGIPAEISDRLADRIRAFKQAIEGWVEHMINLIVLFLLQTLVLPLIFFWILYRFCSTFFDTVQPIPEVTRS